MSYKKNNTKEKVACVTCGGYGSGEVAEAVFRALELIGAASALDRSGSLLIKPNLCLPEPPDKAITTHPEVVRQVVLWCRQYNQTIIVGDCPVGDGDRTRIDKIWKVSGLETALEDVPYTKSFLENNLVEFRCNVNGQPCNYFMSRELSDIKTIINVPKFKTHSLMTYTGAVKNLYGLLPGNTKKKLHSQFPGKRDFATLLVHICRHVKPAVNIMDAVVGLEGDGPGSAGHPKCLKLIMAGTNALAVDMVAAMIMNIAPEEIPTNAVAMEQGILAKEDIEIVGDDINRFVRKDYKVPCTMKYHPSLTKKLFEISQPVIKVNPDKCICCGLCGKNCPTGCIDTTGTVARLNRKACIYCMTCHEICPEAAIEIEEPVFYRQLKEKRSNDDCKKDTE
ncbi:MAG: DUF362 domain-containing protein [Clostridium sp.]|nr:DUF362 domain-containing protein [Clostridium sp.]MCM1398264.1 DUF362 domain-containing protein [Clostridium sp.]MCM1459072.1 DUF362 domain-containing protein [Bacteroides sp.]